MFDSNYIRVYTTNYEIFKKIWELEFRKFFKIVKSDLDIVNKRENVKERLLSLHGDIRARNLFNFYLLILIQGLQEIKKTTKKSKTINTYYNSFKTVIYLFTSNI